MKQIDGKAVYASLSLLSCVSLISWEGNKRNMTSWGNRGCGCKVEGMTAIKYYNKDGLPP